MSRFIRLADKKAVYFLLFENGLVFFLIAKATGLIATATGATRISSIVCKIVVRSSGFKRKTVAPAFMEEISIRLSFWSLIIIMGIVA